MKKLILLLLLPAFVVAQTDYSTLGLVKDRIDSIAKRKADSIYAILFAQVQSKLNATDTPTIRQRSAAAAVNMIVQNTIQLQAPGYSLTGTPVRVQWP